MGLAPRSAEAPIPPGTDREPVGTDMRNEDMA
jgi:hypothetical protein